MDQPNENIVNFYVASNKNKYEIVKPDLVRDYSLAEMTVKACLDALFRHDYVEEDKDYDYHKVIRMILLDSVKDNMHLLEGNKKYESLLDEFNNKATREAIEAKRSIYNAFSGNKSDNEELNKLLSNFSLLQTQIRRGHLLWGAKGERLESDLEHIYGTLLLTLGVESEYGYSVDFDEILETMLIHETDEITIGDPTEFDGYTPEERRMLADNAVLRIFGKTKNGEHYINLLKGFEEKQELKNQYEHLIDKLEYVMQVKMYQMQGRYDFEHRPMNVATQSKSVLDIINNGANDTFEVHYQYDKYRFRDIPCLRRVLEVTRNL